MHIRIGMIKVNEISRIGSLNIGKTIICKSEANDWTYGKPPAEVAGEEWIATGEFEPGLPPAAVEPEPPIAGTLPLQTPGTPPLPLGVVGVPLPQHPVELPPVTRGGPAADVPDIR